MFERRKDTILCENCTGTCSSYCNETCTRACPYAYAEERPEDCQDESDYCIHECTE